jgi:hypothetical protein
MKTLIGLVAFLGLGALLAHFSGVIPAEFGAGLFATFWITLRLIRYFGIRKEIQYLGEANGRAMQDWEGLGKVTGSTSERNEIIRQVDRANKDAGALKRIQW